MELIKPSLFSVISRFPERKQLVQRLFRENETFRTLCDDYGKCVETLSYWNRATSEDSLALREDYTALIREIEDEIRQFIENDIT